MKLTKNEIDTMRQEAQLVLAYGWRTTAPGKDPYVATDGNRLLALLDEVEELRRFKEAADDVAFDVGYKEAENDLAKKLDYAAEKLADAQEEIADLKSTVADLKDELRILEDENVALTREIEDGVAA